MSPGYRYNEILKNITLFFNPGRLNTLSLIEKNLIFEQNSSANILSLPSSLFLNIFCRNIHNCCPSILVCLNDEKGDCSEGRKGKCGRWQRLELEN